MRFNVTQISIMHAIKQLTFLFVLFLSVSNTARAENNDQNLIKRFIQSDTNYIADLSEQEKKYTEFDILRDYIHTAFPKYTWAETTSFNSMPAYNSIELAKRLNAFQDQFEIYVPWALKYIKRPHGRPDFNTLNKWPKNSQIKVSFGWPAIQGAVPQYSNNDIQASRVQANVDYIKESYPKIENQLTSAIEKDIDLINKSIPLNVRFATEENKASDLAQIRIVLTDRFYEDNRFKSLLTNEHSVIAHPPLIYYPRQAQMLFVDAVRFTPLSRTQVEGYFLTDAQNNIEFSVCFIWPHHTLPMLKALAAECLLRSMGLPELSFNNSAILGAWNSIHNSHSKVKLLDGEQVNLPLDYYKNEKRHREILNMVPELKGQIPATLYAQKAEDIKNRNKDYFAGKGLSSKKDQSITAYDQLLLSIHYMCGEGDKGPHKKLAILNKKNVQLKENSMTFCM